jgi:hypothetical protein
MISWRQGRRRICLLICLGALCPVRFITWLVVGFRSSSLFKSRFILWSLLTTAYSGLLSEYETVMSEDRMVYISIYIVEVSLRKA